MEHRLTHACGHEQVYYLPGFVAEQERKARWLRTTRCRACFIAAKRVVEAQAAMDDGAAIAGLALATLVGSERQVAWALTVRARRLVALVAEQGFTQTADQPCLRVADAKWWIDRRDLGDAELLAAAAPAAQAA